jgi:signal peptidase II
MPSAGERGASPFRGGATFFWSLVGLTVALDRITKILAERHLGTFQGVPLIGDTAQLHLVYNRGAAFGLDLGPWSRWIFLVIAIVAIWLLRRMALQAVPTDWLRRLAVGFVAGGAAGNAVDRVISARGVVDFIDIGIGTLRWPTFNVADIAVTCGAVALALSLWREDARRAAPST